MATSATIPNQQQATLTPAQSQTQIPGGTSTAVNPQAAAGNPAIAPGAVPATASNSVMAPATAQGSGINWADGSNTVTGDFKDTYGAGTGTALSDALQGLGTSTSNAVSALQSNTNLEAGNQYKNIQATEAAQGVTPNSSTAALAQGDFYSQVNSNLQSTEANMEESEQTELINSLTNEGSAHGSDPSLLSDITGAMSSIIPGVSSAANALNQTAASGTGGFSDALSALGAL
jgi:hypothetical protein